MNRVTEYIFEYLELKRKGASKEQLRAFLEDNGLLYGHWARHDKIAKSLVSTKVLVEAFGKKRVEKALGFKLDKIKDAEGIIVDDLYETPYEHPIYRDNSLRLQIDWPRMGEIRKT